MRVYTHHGQEADKADQHEDDSNGDACNRRSGDHHACHHVDREHGVGDCPDNDSGNSQGNAQTSGCEKLIGCCAHSRIYLLIFHVQPSLYFQITRMGIY